MKHLEPGNHAAANSVRIGFKTTDAGIVPDDWQVRPLLSVVRVANGQVDPREAPFRSMTLVAPDHIESGTGRLLARATAEEQRAISGKYRFSSGDIVYSKIRPYLRKAILADFDGLCSADMYPLTPLGGISAGYVFAVMLGEHFSKYAESVSVRSGMPKINREELSGYQIAIPPTLDEQDAIAEALSDADALMESLEGLIAKKRAIKQGTMQELLSGCRRLPEFSSDWSTTKLGLVAKIQRGASPRPIDDPAWFDDNSAVGWVRISDVTSSGMYLTEATQKLSVRGIEKSRPVASGSLIMSICATVGRPIITNIDVCIHDGFVVFDELKADQVFLYYVLAWIEKDWSKHGQTGSQMNLNTGLINATEISMPRDINEQKAIAESLIAFDAEIGELEVKLAKARQIRQGMAQELLTGRVRLM